MDRRSFFKSSSLLALSPYAFHSWKASEKNILKPKALKRGDSIGLITPASALSRSAFESTLENIEALGFRPKYSDNIRVRKGFLSGTDEQRLEDLHSMFEDGSVDGIICARGGYGTGRLLPGLDYDLIEQNPKALIGYSDITALHQAIHLKTGLVTFHGPVGASEYNDFTLDHLKDVVFKSKKSVVRTLEDQQEVLVAGSATGKLAGGNLSLLASLIGTPFQVSYKGCILFLEEIGESTYRVDRMLTQLSQSGVLEGVKGIALGYFTDCEAKEGEEGYEVSTSLKEVFRDHFEVLGVPVVAGFPIGHEKHNATLPIGISASLDGEKGKLKLLESATA